MICPRCLRKIKKTDLKMVCNICGKPQEKPKMGMNPFKNLGVIRKKIAGGNACQTSGCLGSYVNVKCGMCGEELPPDIAQYSRYLRLSLIGPSGAGKTVFITTMLQELRQNARTLKFSLSAMNKETSDYQSINTKILYDSYAKKIIGGTTTGQFKALLWRLQDLNKMSSSYTPSYSLTIFDGAGEDQRVVKPDVCRYIVESKMIMLLLDPTKLYGVCSRLDSDDFKRAGGNSEVTRASTEQFVDDMINYIKKLAGLKVSEKITAPVAVVLGKMDVLKQFFPTNSIVFQESGHVKSGHFIQQEADAVHQEIWDFMELCGDDLSARFDANFENWKYFGISSFGMRPQVNRMLQQPPQPMRVLDPLIWDLYLEGIVSGK